MARTKNEEPGTNNQERGEDYPQIAQMVRVLTRRNPETEVELPMTSRGEGERGSGEAGIGMARNGEGRSEVVPP
jgi:hypothetical protein